MTIRLPRVSIKTVPVTCRLDTDLHADPEAYAAAYEAQYGEAIPLAVLITTIVREYLQKDQAFVRQRRQLAAAPQTRVTPDSHTGALSRP